MVETSVFMGKIKRENTFSNTAIGKTAVFGEKNDGNLIISFSNGDVEVYADFTPPASSGYPMDIEAVTSILEKLNVVHGVCWDDIRRTLDECNGYRFPVKNVLIAKGEAPENEITEYFELNPQLIRKARKIDARARIDHREYSPFVIVKKGQTLAKLKPLKPGKDGINVHGLNMPFNIISPEGVSCGTNTRIEGNRIIAEIHGQFIQNKNILLVQENLVIKGAVSYGTGNIVFPGDVYIGGPVSDGFKIFSGGSLTIKQTLDLTEAVAKGNILITGGVIGKGSALLKSGGVIKTKFIENCRVAARGSVMVESEIINSSIFALGRIEMGDKGMIVGGDIYAVHGIKTGGIGKKGGKTTHIHCGIDFVAQQEKERCNSRFRILTAKLTRLRELMEGEELDAEKKASMKELFHRMEAEQQIMSARILELMGNININENAAVEALGEIIPGTLIEICDIALFVQETLRKVRIRLDRASGKLIPEPL